MGILPIQNINGRDARYFSWTPVVPVKGKRFRAIVIGLISRSDLLLIESLLLTNNT